MLFSATMPGPILALARRFMVRPTHIRAQDPSDPSRTKADIKQVVYRAHQLDKIEVMARVLQARGRGLTIIFMRTKRQADRVAGDLADRGFAAAPLHGDLGQGAREQALRDRKSTRLNSSHVAISYAVFCLKKKNKQKDAAATAEPRQ